MAPSYWGIYYKGMGLRDMDAPAAIAQMAEASRLAKEAGDVKTALYIDHWILQTLFSRVGDYHHAYDLAVSSVVEARRPVHRDQMERICVHEDLIAAYLGIDPQGYSSQIESALDYMSKEITPDLQCQYCLLGEWFDFDMACGQLDRALMWTQRYIAETGHIDHHQALAHENMCEILYRQGAWQKLLDYADKGLVYLARVSYLAHHEAAVLAVKALALRKLGRDAEATTAYRLALVKAGKIRTTMSRLYYDGLCDYYLAEGNLEAAVGLRERQLEELAGKGQTYWEAVCRLQLAHLRKRLKQDFSEDIEPIRALAARLRNPELILKPLAELLG